MCFSTAPGANPFLRRFRGAWLRRHHVTDVIRLMMSFSLLGFDIDIWVWGNSSKAQKTQQRGRQVDLFHLTKKHKSGI
jgi:hypothetical protein